MGGELGEHNYHATTDRVKCKHKKIIWYYISYYVWREFTHKNVDSSLLYVLPSDALL